VDTLLQVAAPLLRTAFEVQDIAVTWLEIVAVVLSVVMVICNLRVHVAGWPLAIASSVLYSLLFAHYKLYGEAALQWAFVALAAWGWWQWLRPAAHGTEAFGVSYLTARQRVVALGVTLAVWPMLGALLSAVTDSDVPYLDALPTVASLTGQWLLARKRIENWAFWLGVNVFSLGLFVYKHLWLTAGLYAVFAVLSWIGLRQWIGYMRVEKRAEKVPHHG
jgi:nicotinamide mononucleotide transporter